MGLTPMSSVPSRRPSPSVSPRSGLASPSETSPSRLSSSCQSAKPSPSRSTKASSSSSGSGILPAAISIPSIRRLDRYRRASGQFRPDQCGHFDLHPRIHRRPRHRRCLDSMRRFLRCPNGRLHLHPRCHRVGRLRRCLLPSDPFPMDRLVHLHRRLHRI